MISIWFLTTFFVFNGSCFNGFIKQIFGTPMGSPLSPIIAEIVLQDREEQAFEKLFEKFL